MVRELDQDSIDTQLALWRKESATEIPERVGLAFYSKENGEVEVEVYMADENMWMSQQIMSQLFGVEENTINYHIKEIVKNEELEELATHRKIRVVRNEGKRAVNREILFYSLDDEKALAEFEKYRPIQDKKNISDFERYLGMGRGEIK